MALKMRAAVVERFGKPLLLREHDVPPPAAGQILVKAEACRVCHADLHAANGAPWLCSACRRCEHCLSAWETVCGEAQFGGRVVLDFAAA